MEFYFVLFTMVGIVATAISSMVNNYLIYKTQLIAKKGNEINVDTNERAIRTEKGMEDIRHQTNDMSDKLVEATAAASESRGRDMGIAEGRIQGHDVGLAEGRIQGHDVRRESEEESPEGRRRSPPAPGEA
jgi:hypothetical protein